MQQQLFFFSSSTLSSFTPHFHIPYGNLLACPSERPVFFRKSTQFICCSSNNIKGNSEKNNEKDSRRRLLMGILSSSYFFPSLSSFANTKGRNPYDEMRLLEQNRRRQRENNVPEDFPSFIREGFQVKVLTSDKYVKRDSGLIYWDLEVGKGDCPRDGQQVTFHYVGYNESGRRIDSTYLQNSPAKIRMGTNSLVPGFEEGIRDMKPGGKRRIIIPPELGPPVGPSTFFSSKQFEVFDVELLNIKDCQRRTIGFYSDVVERGSIMKSVISVHAVSVSINKYSCQLGAGGRLIPNSPPQIVLSSLRIYNK